MTANAARNNPRPASWFRETVFGGALAGILATGLTSIAPVHAQEGLRVMRNDVTQYRVVSPQHLLKDTFVSDVASCRGWGAWTTPFVLANSSDETAKLLSGGISIPPRSVAVHPGSDRDVAVGWQSPLSGKVSIRAKVSAAHNGDGVAWAILHQGQARPRCSPKARSNKADRRRSRPQPTWRN